MSKQNKATTKTNLSPINKKTNKASSSTANKSKKPTISISKSKQEIRNKILRIIKAQADLIEIAGFDIIIGDQDNQDESKYQFKRSTWINIFQRMINHSPDEKIPDNIDETCNSCWGGPRDHWQVSCGNKKAKYLAYNLSFVFFNPQYKNEILDRDHSKRKRATVSHKCHREGNNCWNPYCLTYEIQELNEDRKGCVYGSLSNCPHIPKCIFKQKRRRLISKDETPLYVDIVEN